MPGKKSPTSIQYQKYQGLYDYFNSNLFLGELPDCLLNFSRKGMRNAGHFSPKRWEGRKGTEVHEININPMHLALVSDLEVCQTLVHEMCHLWQEENGKPSRNGYHNKEWASKMIEVGLMPSTTGEPGGATTGQNMSDYPVEHGRFMEVFNRMPKTYLLPFKSRESFAEAASTSRNKVKYTCTVCLANVWGKSGLAITCDECHQSFEEL